METRLKTYIRRISRASLDTLKLDNELDGLRGPNLGGVSRAGYSVPLTSVLSMNLVFLFKYKLVY